MYSSSSIFAVLFVILGCRDCALALRCYQCTGSTSFFQGCMVPFVEYLIECPRGTIGCYVNYTPPGRGTEAVERGCGHSFGITLHGGSGCEQQPQLAQYPPFAETTVCNCDGDACNINRINSALSAINITKIAQLSSVYLSPEVDAPNGRLIEKSKNDHVTYIGVSENEVPPRLQEATREGRRVDVDGDNAELRKFRNDETNGIIPTTTTAQTPRSNATATRGAAYFERLRGDQPNSATSSMINAKFSFFTVGHLIGALLVFLRAV